MRNILFSSFLAMLLGLMLSACDPTVINPNADKTYTYLGGLIIPPAFYEQAPDNDINKLQICGFDTPDAAGLKVCADFGNIYNHLYSYEHLGLDVWDVRDDWYLVLVRDGQHEIWLQRPSGEFKAYPELIKEGLAYMGDWDFAHDPQWPTEGWTTPQGPKVAFDPKALPETKSENPLVVLSDARIMSNKDVWFQVSFTNNVCADNNRAVIMQNVWYPAYRKSLRLNLPTFWFYPKGC
jgi:hypothetical protein